MKLSEIINIEYQLHIDARSDPVEVRKRDREIGKSYDGSEEDRADIFRGWLNKLEDKNPFPGQSFSSALTFLRYLVFFFFLVSGASVCAGILAYDGSRPVNVVNFLALFVGLQLLLYILFLMNILPGTVRSKIPFIGDFYRFTGFIFSHIAGKISNRLYRNKSESVRQITSTFHRVKSRNMIYQKIERWILFSITQLGGFAFSLGALASCVYLITFSDLAFAWNTTLDITPAFFHRLVSFISAPWAFISAKLVPTIDLVEATRYFRLDGNYSSLQSSALAVGGWWPFLICTLIFYGLIPRFVFLMLSRFMLLGAQKKAPFLSAEFDSLYRRLTYPILSTQTDTIQYGEKKPGKPEFKNPDTLPAKNEVCHIIVWGEIDLSEAEIEKIIKSRFKWNASGIHYAGMLDNLQDEQTLRHFEGSRDDKPILILAESWEAPGKALKHFIGRLRADKNDTRRIILGLINRNAENQIIAPSRTDWQNWQDAVSRLNDPFTCIEPVSESM